MSCDYMLYIHICIYIHLFLSISISISMSIHLSLTVFYWEYITYFGNRSESINSHTVVDSLVVSKGNKQMYVEITCLVMIGLQRKKVQWRKWEIEGGDIFRWGGHS